jgi:DNA (cytosine-5)-methyltransferase 1
VNYYNENDRHAAAWLRELIKAGLIAPGIVDERSIVDVHPGDLAEYRQCHFFAGIGGWSYALRISKWPDDEPVWTGSCPCQPLSCAGKQRGHDDERHLWPAFYRLISECKPATVFGEQVAGAAGREWLAGVRADLEGAGYAVGASDLCAAGVGAPHRRNRIYWVADSICEGLEIRQKPKGGSRTVREQRNGWKAAGQDMLKTPWSRSLQETGRCGNSRRVQPGICPMANGVPGRMGLVRGYGNAIVPQVAAEFILASVEAINEVKP